MKPRQDLTRRREGMIQDPGFMMQDEGRGLALSRKGAQDVVGTQMNADEHRLFECETRLCKSVKSASRILGYRHTQMNTDLCHPCCRSSTSRET